MLPAVPCDKESHAYRRLRRVWFDHTAANHPFLTPHCEDHLSATLFENFILFKPAKWLPRLLAMAGFDPPVERLAECEWGYQAQDVKSTKMADVGIHARGPAGDYVILVEAKAKRGPLKKMDTNPDSYLELGEFADIADKCLIYLVDELDLQKTQNAIIDPKKRSGVITWQQLGGLQIDLALQLNCEAILRDFIAGAIQYQYLVHGIRPSTLVAEYLTSEPTLSEINKLNPEKMRSWRTDWRIGCSDEAGSP